MLERYLCQTSNIFMGFKVPFAVAGHKQQTQDMFRTSVLCTDFERAFQNKEW